MGENNKYWNGLEELEGGASFEQAQKDEFSEEASLEQTLSEDSLGGKSNRRDFLKIFGFGITAATLAACETPLKKAIPYVNKPENLMPGIANYYASTCTGCGAGCGILVKTREGRPIKIEGNELAHSKGGVCAAGQATVLSLYDAERLRVPKAKGEKGISWNKVDENIKAQLTSISNSGGKIFIVTGTANSPSGMAAMDIFFQKYPGAEWVSYDPVSVSAIAKAHKRTHGNRVIPTYKFDRAKVIVSFGADFLGTWISPVEFTKDYVTGRKLNRTEPEMSKHYQFEGHMSLTGSNADYRLPVSASKEGLALLNLHNKVAALVGGEAIGGVGAFDVAGNAIDTAAKDLAKAKGASLVVCGTNDPNMQEIVNRINMMLGNYGSTILANVPSNQRTGDEEGMERMIASLADSKNAVIFVNSNPVYNHPDGEKLAGLIAKATLSVSITTKEDETSASCQYALPAHHYLESWMDHNPRLGQYTMTQPAIRPIFESRQDIENFLVWAGNTTPWYDFMRKNWETVFFPIQSKHLLFDDFWNAVVHDGVWANEKEQSLVMNAEAVLSSDPQKAGAEILATKFSGMDLVIYESVNLRDGSQANNPWLQELPEPVSKITWDNFLSVPYKYAKEQNLKDGDYLALTANGKTVELPVYIQPGQAANTLALSVGYGRTNGGKVANGIGQNAYKLLKSVGGNINYTVTGASVAGTGRFSELAKVQTFTGYELAEGPTGTKEDGAMSRGNIEYRVKEYILKETTLAEYQEDRTAGNKNRLSKESMITLWKTHEKKGYHWAMAIDLNACTGCGSCIVACNAENNVAVVGKDEVRRRRDMHWMRLDRYFRGNPEKGEAPANLDEVLHMAHQPMLCQHCDNAPCETVCPVLATMHSTDGLNQQIYNRCIGTRYCANNCPYKVRRFNWFSYYDNSWFDYNLNDQYGKLVLNPDVTVRARGVMEKCSFCVQRIQEKKLKAKTEGRKVAGDEVKTACQQSCPAGAISFGDIMDENSEINKMWRNERAFHALEEVKTLPGIAYLTKVRNINKPANAPAEAPKSGDHHS